MTLLSSGLVIAGELSVSQAIPDFNLAVGESVDLAPYIINPAGLPITTALLGLDPAVGSYSGTVLTAVGVGTMSVTLEVTTS